MRAEIVAGVDEAGRGALAGPVVTAAVILGEDVEIKGVADSKKLTAAARRRLSEEIRMRSECWAIGVSSVDEIERLNILQATMLAMARAIGNLSVRPDRALIDGNRSPQVSIPTKAIVGGDGIVKEISAASIVAKVCRDEMMRELAFEYPHYGFEAHFGYGTAKHLKALHAHGATPIHRRSFAPVRQVIDSLF